MSSNRHGTPLMRYSDSPVRKSVRVIVTSLNSIGSSRAALSIVSETSARPSAGRSAVPAKITSSIFVPRNARAPWAPSTHATESTMFDFPDPFGPTTTHTPGSNSSVVLSAKDLKPFSVNAFKNKKAPSPTADGRGCAVRPRGPGRSPNAESLIAAGGDDRDVDRADPRPGRSGTAPGDQPVDRGRGTFDLRLDRTVAAISDPSSDVLLARPGAARVAEEHALDPTRYDHPYTDRVRVVRRPVQT